jgi:hypothetical protein
VRSTVEVKRFVFISQEEVTSDDRASVRPGEVRRGVRALMVAVFSEGRDQAELTQASSLRETIHTLANLEVYCVVVK